jgi:hypothetical protein
MARTTKAFAMVCKPMACCCLEGEEGCKVKNCAVFRQIVKFYSSQMHLRNQSPIQMKLHLLPGKRFLVVKREAMMLLLSMGILTPIYQASKKAHGPVKILFLTKLPQLILLRCLDQLLLLVKLYFSL